MTEAPLNSNSEAEVAPSAADTVAIRTRDSSDSSPECLKQPTAVGFDLRREWLFAGLLGSFCLIYALWYPATISISDESSILSLAYSIEHGTIYTEGTVSLLGIRLRSYVVSFYSPFHAALLVPAIGTNWRLAFLVSAAFFVAGAFIMRGMLRRSGLGSGWCALYFLLPGATYYSQTIMAALPAAVMALLGVSLCLRESSRPLPAGLAFGASVLLHPWMGPIAVVFSSVWCIEQGLSRLRRNAVGLFVGALPAITALSAYNYMTTGNPIRHVYLTPGFDDNFWGHHLVHYLTFYVLSLAIFPLAGWTIFSRRWCGTWALPWVSVVVVAMASLYDYRDGLNVGSARVGTALAEIAGSVPGQRFLLPVSLIACLPAARFLNGRIAAWTPRRITAAKLVALGTSAGLFVLLSILHEAYLEAHAEIQEALEENVPSDSQIAGSRELLKEFAPTKVLYRHIARLEEGDTPPQNAYVAFLTLPGQRPAKAWTAGRNAHLIRIRSWVWNRDLWIENPDGQAR